MLLTYYLHYYTVFILCQEEAKIGCWVVLL